VSLALALAPEPELLVMDDPAMGLDPVARRTLLEAMILVTRDSGRTILFSSHLLADVERVADRIAILDRSVMRASCSVESFLSRIKHYAVRFATPELPPLPKIQGLLLARQQDNEWQLVVANPDITTEPTLREMAPVAIDALPLTLEDAVIGYLSEQTVQPTLLQEMAVAS
jgi:ABC-2 type transport system ATP-binding protein